MRKRIVEQGIQEGSDTDHNWFNIEHLAQAEISSEADGHPIESAFSGSDSCWQAATAGEQTLRLVFDEPQYIRVIRLLFQGDHQERTQEFVLRWSGTAAGPYHDIARQQYNFSSPDSTRELETYNVDLHAVTSLELSIVPDISGGNARASLCEWRIA